MQNCHDAAVVGSEKNKTKELRKKNDVMKLLSSKNDPNKGVGENGEATPFKLAPFNPSSDQIQQKALEMLNLDPTDVLFDLGCGDGRLLCFAATKIPGLRCVGIEIEAEFVSRGRDRVRQSQLEGNIDIRLEDATKAGEKDESFEADKGGTTTTTANTVANIATTSLVQNLTLMDDATALYLFILPKGIVKMMTILESLKRKRLAEGKRFKVLSYMFKIHDWEATIIDETAKGSCPVYYYEFGGTL